MKTKHLLQSSLLLWLLVGFTLPAWSDESPTTDDKVIFHVDETSNARWAIMLANSYLDDRPKAKIVFVTYGPGIDFLLEDTKDRRGQPYDPAVLSLVEKGVEFHVCAETLGARNIAKEDVLDAAVIIPSGITKIVRLQNQEGYAYLKP